MASCQSPIRRRNRVQCQSCNKSFGRTEHLHRHVLSTHTSEKPHICSRCGKGFTRSDILSRHIVAHDSDDLQKGPLFRACENCHRARAKCSGNTTCQRCVEKLLECEYPPQSKSRAKKKVRVPSLTDTESINNEAAEFESPGRNVSQVDPWNTTLPNDEYRLVTVFSPNGDSNQQQSSISDIDMIGSSREPEDISSGSIFPGQGQISPLHGPNSLWAGDMGYQQAFGMGDLNAHVPYIAPDFSGRVPGGEIAEIGCSTINWLSPSDMNYTQFMFETQFLPVDAFAPVPLNGPIPELETQELASPSIQLSSGQVFRQDEERENGSTQDQIELKVSQSHHSDSPINSNYSESASTPSKYSTYYVDGANTREPRYGKLWEHSSSQTERLSNIWEILDQKTHQTFCFPDDIATQALRYSHSFPKRIPEDIYNRMLIEFRKYCLGARNSFGGDYFPPIEVLDLSIHLYFEYFHPVFPILHKVSFIKDPENQSWLIFLAIVSIGIGFLGSKKAIQSSEAFLEFLRRALDHLEFSGVPLDLSNINNLSSSKMIMNELSMIQANILNVLGMFHSCSDALVEKAFSGRSKLVTICLRHTLLNERRTTENNGDAEVASSKKWKDWIFTESRNRAGYCIWWLDSMIAYEADYRPQMRLDDAKNMLPCHETMWEAPNEAKFGLAQGLYPECPSLLVALQGLYKKKTIDSGIGEFSRILIIHGLYRRTWEVANYHTDTLSNWIPSAPGTREPSPSGSSSYNWLPGNPAYSKWRNSACDCLDILHWAGNSLVARRAGIEHPTILHLHLARLILLTPGAKIKNLATEIIQGSRESPQSNKDRQEVMRWFIQDQYKARLAIVHAGAIFWHVRRYSHDSMFEPFAVFMATLVVWVYATSSQAVNEVKQQQKNLKTQTQMQSQCNKNENSTSPESRDDDDSEADIDSPFINLDRLCDDELIQIFVLHGTKMTGYMAGIGDICAPGSASKILKEGAKILARSGAHLCAREGGERSIGPLPTWGVALKHVAFLEELRGAVERRGGPGPGPGSRGT